MPIFHDSGQLETTLRMLFTRLAEQDASSARAVSKTGLVMRLYLTSPPAQVVINGRKNPSQINYGATQLKPDLDVEITADALHFILLDKLPLRKAMASGQLKVRGPFWKSLILRDIFQQGQIVYPKILHEVGIEV